MRWDGDGNGTISRAEFELSVVELAGTGRHVDRRAVDDLYNAFDIDLSGSIDLKELDLQLKRYKPTPAAQRRPHPPMIHFCCGLSCRRCKRAAEKAAAEAAAVAAREAAAKAAATSNAELFISTASSGVLSAKSAAESSAMTLEMAAKCIQKRVRRALCA